MARALAARLGYIHIDTGAMYRAVTWLALRQGVDLDDAAGLTSLAQTADICFAQGGPDTAQSVYCRGQDITGEIRSPQVSAAVSVVSAVEGVREALVGAQRRMAADRDVVMDGRDIGTVVLPQAECKIYLTASVEARAGRRQREWEGKDTGLTLAETEAAIRKRDEDDMRRESSPLEPAADSILLDTTSLSFQEVLDIAAGMVRSVQNTENHKKKEFTE